MEDIKRILEELKSLMARDDEQSAARRDEIIMWIKNHRCGEVDEAFKEFMTDGLDDIAAEIQDIRRRISDEDYRLLPISYIAEKYFGKSPSWLSQRINGTKVRGKVYTLNEEQKEIFNQAMQDLAKFYGSFRLT